MGAGPAVHTTRFQSSWTCAGAQGVARGLQMGHVPSIAGARVRWALGGWSEGHEHATVLTTDTEPQRPTALDAHSKERNRCKMFSGTPGDTMLCEPPPPLPVIGWALGGK